MKQSYFRPLWGLPARMAASFTQRLAQAGAGAALLVALPGLAQAQTISGFAPTSGVAGTPITLTGTGLADASVVIVNGVGVVPTSVTATSLVFVVPAGTSTARTVMVTTRAGTNVASAAFAVVPLEVTGTNPAANALTAPLANSAMNLTFTEPVTAASAASLRVYSSQLGGRKAGTVTVRSNTASFAATAGTPRTNFKPGETVSVSVPASVRSTGGLAATRRVYQFTTAVGGPGRGNFRPGPGTDPAVGTQPVSVAAGDMDGDGDLDLVTANYGSSTVSVRLNGGDATGSNTGAFSGGSNAAVGNGPLRMVLGDVDGDGDLDVVTANANATGTVSVRLNGGNNLGTNTGVLSGGSTVAVGAYPIGMALADVDGDGDLDLLTANSGETTVSVRLNGGNATGSNTGTFTNGGTVSVGGDAQTLAVGDVDGDGDLDLVTAGYYYNMVSVRLNGGDATGSNTGAFTNGTNLALTGAGTVVLGDVDGDGDLDMLVNTGSAHLVRVFLNGGNATGSNTGVFSGGSSVAANGDITLGDVDGDGDLDLLSANAATGTVAVRLNGGDATGSNTGTFSGGSDPAVGPNPNLVTLGDVDGDGDLDLLATDGTTNSVSVRLNQGPAPTLTAVAPNPGGLGQVITLTGTNLGSPMALTINGANALPNIISNSGTSLVVRVPLGAAATGTVSLSTVAGPATLPFAVMAAPGNSLAFDGVNDYLRPAGTLPATGEFTLETWVNPTALSSSPNSLSAVLMTDYFVVGSMHCQFYGNRLGFSVGGNSPVDQVSNLALPVGRWAHVAVVYSASARTAKFYFNGTLVDARTYTTAQPLKAHPYTVGAWQASGAPQRYFNGKLDELRVYSAALTQAQVQADMLSTAPAASLSFYLNFDQGTPAGNNAGLTTLYDLTSAQPATLTNFALSSGNTTSNYVPGYVPETPPATPTDADPAANAVAENAAAGTPVGLTVAVLGATNATLTYSLTDNAGGRFAIDAATGVVTVANGALLDFEAATSYAITAQASDGLLSSSATFAIALTDVNEAPVVAAQAYTTQEDGAAGTVVGTVLATDPDAGQTLTYTLTAGNTGGAFALVGNQLQVANSAALDYAATPTFALTVEVADNGTPALTSTATLTVTLTPAPCAAPTAVGLSGISATAVNVSFTGSATATGYVVSYTGGGTTNSVNSATSPVALTGLLPNTPYAITVASTCSRTQTAVSAPVTFTTFCEVPTLAAIADQQVPVDAGQCGAAVSFSAQAGGTPAPSVRFVANSVLITSPHVFPVGTTTVEATASSCGGTATSTFTVTVLDNVNPTIVAPAAVAVGTDAGQCAATGVALGTATATDNCSGVVVTNNAPTTFPKGTTTVTWTATDAAGNKATATQTVTVRDTERPVLAALPNLRVSAPATACGAVVSFAPSAGDNCPGTTVVASPASGSTFAVGTTMVSVTATDASGNIATTTFTVTVSDVTPPTALTRNLTVALVNGTATITATQLDGGSNDACGPVTLALSKTTFTCANAGPNTVTLTVTDSHGLTATAPATVTVTGGAVTPTVNVAPASLFDGKQYRLYLGYGAQTATLTATGGVSYSWSPATGLSNPTVANPVFAPTVEGTYTFTVTATSAGGCRASSTVTIVVEDVRCGNNNDKVQVCHNGQVICVASSALSTHLGHGDRLGSCAASREAEPAAAAVSPATTSVLAVYPNPTAGSATLTGTTAGASVTVLDAVGRVVLSATADASGTAALALPAELPSGVYVVRAGTQAVRLTVE